MTIYSGISTRMGLQTSLADFSFLSIVAYEDRDTTKASLDTWFGSDMGDTSSANAIDHQDIVEQFQAVYDERKHGRSAVTYKLIGFPDQNVGVVSIRGTSNGWDAFTNAQLWSSAALTQGIRSILPLGDLLTPLLKYLVKAVSLIESRRLQNISYYRETTAFVTFLKKLGIYENIVITGHCKYPYMNIFKVLSLFLRSNVLTTNPTHIIHHATNSTWWWPRDHKWSSDPCPISGHICPQCHDISSYI